MKKKMLNVTKKNLLEKILLVLSVITSSLTLSSTFDERYVFNPTNNQKLLASMNVAMFDTGLIVGDIYVYDQPKTFGSSGIRTYFQKTINPFNDTEETEDSTLNQDGNKIFKFTIAADYIQKFDVDGLGRRKEKFQGDITFEFLGKIDKGNETINSTMEVKEITKFSFDGKTYSVPADKAGIIHSNPIWIFLITIFLTFFLSIPFIGDKNSKGGSASTGRNPRYRKSSGVDEMYFALIYFKGNFYFVLSYPMFFLLLATLIQYPYLVLLWPTLFFYFSFGLVCWFRGGRNRTKAHNAAEKRLKEIIGFSGFAFFILGFFETDLAFFLMFIFVCFCFCLDLSTGGIKEDTSYRICQFVLFALEIFCGFYGSVNYTFFNKRTFKGYPVDDNYSVFFTGCLVIFGLVSLGLCFFGKDLSSKGVSLINLFGSKVKNEEKKVGENKGNELKKRNVSNNRKKKAPDIGSLGYPALSGNKASESAKPNLDYPDIKENAKEEETIHNPNKVKIGMNFERSVIDEEEDNEKKRAKVHFG